MGSFWQRWGAAPPLASTARLSVVASWRGSKRSRAARLLACSRQGSYRHACADRAVVSRRPTSASCRMFGVSRLLHLSIVHSSPLHVLRCESGSCADHVDDGLGVRSGVHHFARLRCAHSESRSRMLGTASHTRTHEAMQGTPWSFGRVSSSLSGHPHATYVEAASPSARWQGRTICSSAPQGCSEV